MRQFSLKNNNGEVYRLNSSDNFFHDPSGLGFERSATFQKIGSRYEVIQDGFNQTPIKGQIMFKSGKISAYNRYLKFRNFLQQIPLTLVYRIPGGEFLMDCIPGTVEKTEINSSLGMDIGIELIPLSMWYQDILKSYNGTSVSIISDSLIESPCCLSFSGITKSNASLSWSQSVGGVTVVTGTLSGVSIASTDTTYVRTDTNPYQIYKVSSGGTKTDLYGKSDFSTKRFPLLRKGSNTFTVSGASLITIEGKVLYETV
jgi:hypothetical protein